jgi:hypothetical protein
MRLSILLILILAVSASCGRNPVELAGGEAHQAQSSDTPGVHGIEFRTQRHDFGNVSQGEKLVYTFIYKNTGDVPLVVHSARADCGCTVPEFSSKPLAPGNEGTLKTVFDTQGFRGYQTKTIQVNTSAGLQTLVIRAVVE